MAMMGRPNIVNANNPYRKIGMKESLTLKSDNKMSNEDIIRKASGGTERSLIVDGKKNNKMGKDEFLKLLTHQLQNQDPGKPVDQKQMASQLAQFASLEQMSNMNSNLKLLNNNSPMEAKFYAASFLGKQITTNGSSLHWKNDGKTVDINFDLKSPAKSMMVRIFDLKGNMVRQIDFENISQGPQKVEWDGKQFDGDFTKKGYFAYKVMAYDQDNRQIPVQNKAIGTVTGVRFDKGETILIVDGKKVNLRDINTFDLGKPKMRQ